MEGPTSEDVEESEEEEPQVQEESCEVEGNEEAPVAPAEDLPESAVEGSVPVSSTSGDTSQNLVEKAHTTGAGTLARLF